MGKSDIIIVAVLYTRILEIIFSGKSGRDDAIIIMIRDATKKNNTTNQTPRPFFAPTLSSEFLSFAEELVVVFRGSIDFKQKRKRYHRQY